MFASYNKKTDDPSRCKTSCGCKRNRKRKSEKHEVRTKPKIKPDRTQSLKPELETKALSIISSIGTGNLTCYPSIDKCHLIKCKENIQEISYLRPVIYHIDPARFTVNTTDDPKPPYKAGILGLYQNNRSGFNYLLLVSSYQDMYGNPGPLGLVKGSYFPLNYETKSITVLKETPETASIREFQEETGLELKEEELKKHAILNDTWIYLVHLTDDHVSKFQSSLSNIDLEISQIGLYNTKILNKLFLNKFTKDFLKEHHDWI